MRLRRRAKVTSFVTESVSRTRDVYTFLYKVVSNLLIIFVLILEEEELQAKTVEKMDAETQTDPEITGVDADDFEEDDGEGEETGSESSEDEDEDLEAGEDGQSKSVDRGTSSKPVRRKIIELKYYFGEDLPDAELTKREFGIYNFSPSTWSSCIN